MKAIFYKPSNAKGVVKWIEITGPMYVIVDAYVNLVEYVEKANEINDTLGYGTTVRRKVLRHNEYSLRCDNDSNNQLAVFGFETMSRQTTLNIFLQESDGSLYLCADEHMSKMTISTVEAGAILDVRDLSQEVFEDITISRDDTICVKPL